MKRNLYIIAIASLVLPLLVRGLWFHRGFVVRPAISIPDYSSFTAPTAPVNPTDASSGDIKQYSGTVLVDTAHGNQFDISDIESFTGAIKQSGGQVELLSDTTSLEYKLRYASAFVIVSPSYSFAADEVQAMVNFADRGGKLLVFTDATHNYLGYDYFSGNPIAYGDVDVVNPLLAKFGITINNDYLYNIDTHEGNFRNVYFDEFGKNELTFGLKQVALYGTHSVESPSGLLLLQGPKTNFSSTSDAHDPAQGGAALSEDGNVVAFGDFTFLTMPYATYADDASLVANLADYSLAGSQKTTLANFPFLYKGKVVQVYLAPDLTKTAEMISALGRLQTAMNQLDVKLEFTEDYPKDGDAIILSTLTPPDDLTPLINKFDLVLDDGSGNAAIPGFGSVGASGNTFVVYDVGTKGNKVALFAGSSDDAIFLLDILSSGAVSSCLTQDFSAICSTGYSSTDYSSDYSTDTTTTDSTSTPEVTATPSG